ncbi:MAG: hypothetical protein WCQ77_03345 [Planctomycetota bacterium]
MQTPAPTCVLLAAGFDWLEAILPFLFVAFWIVSQVFGLFRRLQGGGQKPPLLPRFDPERIGRGRPPLPAGDAEGPRTELQKQIEEFLREATGEQRPKPVATKPMIKPMIKKPNPRREVAAKKPPAMPLSTAEKTESVARHVHDAFGTELKHLRGGLGFEERQAATVEPAGVAPQAKDLVKMLRDPATIRQVILLREILDRPIDRW